MDGLKDFPLPQVGFSVSHLCTLSVDMVLCFPCMDCNSIVGIPSLHRQLVFSYPLLQCSFRLSYVSLITLLQGISYTTPFFLRSGVGVFTQTRDSLRVLGDLKTVLMSRCLHFLWIYSERPLTYGSSRNLGLPSGGSCIVSLSLVGLRSECSIILFG